MSKETMSSTVKWLNNMKFEGVDSHSHPIPMEATIRFGGSGANPMPLELLLSSLGGCIGVDTKYLLKQNGKDYHSFEVRIEGISETTYQGFSKKFTSMLKLQET
jgi:putative redox protein